MNWNSHGMQYISIGGRATKTRDHLLIDERLNGPKISVYECTTFQCTKYTRLIDIFNLIAKFFM